MVTNESWGSRHLQLWKFLIQFSPLSKVKINWGLDIHYSFAKGGICVGPESLSAWGEMLETRSKILYLCAALSYAPCSKIRSKNWFVRSRRQESRLRSLNSNGFDPSAWIPKMDITCQAHKYVVGQCPNEQAFGSNSMPASQNMATQSLIRTDAKQFLLDNCGEIYEEWTSLQAKTTFPVDATSSDQRILDMLMILDLAFSKASQRTAQLASIQLTRVLKRLKEKVKEERRCGLIDGKRSKRDASTVTDIYCKATGKSRALVLSNTRFANRCSALANDSLLAVILSDQSTKLM